MPLQFSFIFHVLQKKSCGFVSETRVGKRLHFWVNDSLSQQQVMRDQKSITTKLHS